MITSLSDLDLTQKYSYADYLTWQFAERVELLKGYIRNMAAPNPFHQEISNELLLCFKPYLKAKGGLCTVFVAPFDVRLYNHKKSALLALISLQFNVIFLFMFYRTQQKHLFF